MNNKQLIDRSLFFLASLQQDFFFVQQHIQELREVIKLHNEHYYLTSDPLISDMQYDQLFALLKQREDQWPELITQDSPTQRLVGQKIDGFVSARHLASMSSLQNTYNGEEIAKRDDGLKRIQKKEGIALWTYIIEPKLDGMSVEIVYEYGLFVRAVTRGDGEEGEDITEHAKGLQGLPLHIAGLAHIEQIAFRGEIVMPKKAFAQLSGIMTTSGGEFANARNATAGTLRQLDTSLVKKRGLTILVYDILFVAGDIYCETSTEQFALFRTWGLPCHEWLQQYNSIDDVIACCISESTQERAYMQDIDLDGLVVKVEQFAVRKYLGSTNHHPRRAIAYKFPAQQIATQLIDVKFQVGRTGVLTPVAYLEPIQLSGVTISKATLHNRAFIQDRGLRLGDRVMIQRSGEVIPYIVATLDQRRDGSERTIALPTKCPVCDHTVILDEEALTLRCTNSACAAQIKQRLEHAVSKGCLDIAGLGPRLIELLVDSGVLRTIADIFLLPSVESKRLLMRLPGIATKKVEQIEQEIQKKRPRELRRVINALSIRHIGEVSARDLAKTFFEKHLSGDHYIDEFLLFLGSIETIRAIYGFGEEMVASIHAFFNEEVNKKLMYRLDVLGCIAWEGGRQYGEGYTPLQDKRIVVTGSFDQGRDALEDQLRTWGATIQASVSTTTDFVVAGSGGGSKRDQATSKGIPIYGYAEMIALFGITENSSQIIKTQEQKVSDIQQMSLFG